MQNSSYNHKEEPGISVAPSTTEQLLAFGHGQCDAWANLFESILSAQGVASGTTGTIIAATASSTGTGPDFLVNGYDFVNPVGQDYNLDPQYAGFNWRLGQKGDPSADVVPEPDDMSPWQGKGDGVAPGTRFPYHKVITIGNLLYDPSYGTIYGTNSGTLQTALQAWEEENVVGLAVSPGSTYVKKRPAGAAFVKWLS